MIIYKITNKINGKIYIGQTTSLLQKRWNSHCNRKDRRGISNAIFNYGKENFIIEEIDGANDQSELNYLEQHYIYIYNSIAPNGYNILSGGKNSKHTEESKLKMRKPKNFGNRTDFSYRKHSKKTIEKIREIKKKNPLVFTKEHREKISKANKNKKHKEETKLKISASKKGHTYNRGRKYNKPKSSSIKIIATNAKNTIEIIFNSILEASKILCLNTGSISNALSGKSKQASGWKFRRYG